MRAWDKFLWLPHPKEKKHGYVALQRQGSSAQQRPRVEGLLGGEVRKEGELKELKAVRLAKLYREQRGDMIPIICIVGRKNSGKTLLIERLIPQLQALGYRIGTLKHHHHKTNLDVEGKDSWRHSQAGADAVAILSPVQFVLFRKVNTDVTPESLVPLLGEVDCVLLEGFKASPYPKIEIHRPALDSEPLCAQKDHLIALVSDQPLERGVPCFTWQEIPTLARFIQSRFLAQQQA